jgi:hypothetical protein
MAAETRAAAGRSSKATAMAIIGGRMIFTPVVRAGNQLR